jgi:hypothetical protein
VAEKRPKMMEYRPKLDLNDDWWQKTGQKLIKKWKTIVRVIKQLVRF